MFRRRSLFPSGVTVRLMQSSKHVNLCFAALSAIGFTGTRATIRTARTGQPYQARDSSPNNSLGIDAEIALERGPMAKGTDAQHVAPIGELKIDRILPQEDLPRRTQMVKEAGDGRQQIKPRIHQVAITPPPPPCVSTCEWWRSAGGRPFGWCKSRPGRPPPQVRGNCCTHLMASSVGKAEQWVLLHHFDGKFPAKALQRPAKSIILGRGASKNHLGALREAVGRHYHIGLQESHLSCQAAVRRRIGKLAEEAASRVQIQKSKANLRGYSLAFYNGDEPVMLTCSLGRRIHHRHQGPNE